MKVRIGIITRNRASLLPKAIDSALAQTHPEKEIAVFDIASSDETPALRKNYPQAVWLRSDTRLDMISPKNRLMSENNADFYFSLDDDAWFVAPDQLALGVSLMVANPKLAILAYDIRLPGNPERPLARETMPAHVFVACGALLRKSALEKVGYYRPLPAVYGGYEETDLCLRLLDAGYDIRFWPGQHIWHERTATGRNSDEQHASLVCNELVSVLTTSPFLALCAEVPWKVFRHGLHSVRHRRTASFLSGLRMFAKAWSRATAARKPVSLQTYRDFRQRAKTMLAFMRA